MKTFISIIGVISVSSSLKAQAQYLSLGYQYSRMNLPGINRSIQTYNTGNLRDSQYSLKPMREVKGFGGFSLGFGLFSGKSGYDFSLFLAKSLREAYAPDFNGVVQYRNLVVKEQTGAFTYFKVLGSTGVAFVFGARAETGWIRYYYQGWAENQAQPEPERIHAHFTARLGPSAMIMLRFGRLGMQLTGYRVWALTNSNSTRLDEKLNLSVFRGGPNERFDNRTHTTSLQAKLLFYFDDH